MAERTGLSVVPAVPVSDLHQRLGFARRLEYPHSSLVKPLVEWKMEVDDAPILRYLYRNFRPRRHLEFGTWEGTGTLYCLTESDATVWTINLPGGERTVDDRPAYYLRGRVKAIRDQRAALRHSRGFRRALPEAVAVGPSDAVETVASDAIGSVGRFYLEAGLGHRVCQIYCDSREWDVSQYPKGFFDSAFIDGGHSEKVVSSDTAKAFELVRPGGLVLWHDFCPDEAVGAQCGSTVGVAAAIRRNRSLLLREMSDLFWVEPSWLLVGVRR